MTWLDRMGDGLRLLAKPYHTITPATHLWQLLLHKKISNVLACLRAVIMNRES
jgi:hypothetical protein